MMRLPLFVILGAALLPSVAHAYIGPGLGAGAIAAVLGTIGALLLAVFAVIYYPIKRAMKKRKAASTAEETSGESANT